MRLDRLDTFDFAIEAPARTVAASKPAHRAPLYLAAGLLALAVYGALTAWLVSTNTAKVYGFAISHDPRSAIEIALQVCPMLAAMLVVACSSALDRLARHLAPRFKTPPLAMTIAVSATAAASIAVTTACAIVCVCGAHASLPSLATSLWVAGELTFDITLIGVFAAALFHLTRKTWVTILLFLVYVFAVAYAGSRWGVTSYIGFGSTVPVQLTTYSTAPLYDSAGWLLRGYWTCVTALLIAALHAFDFAPEPILSLARIRSLRWRPSLLIAPVLLVLSVLAGFALFRLQQFANTRGRATDPAALSAEARKNVGQGRLELTSFDVRLTFSPDQQAVEVEGNLSLTAGDHPIQTAWFEIPEIMTGESLQFTSPESYRAERKGKYLRLTFAKPLSPAAQVEARYSATLKPLSAFDLPVRARILDDAFFLTDADILVAARRAECIGPAQTACSASENYLMSDRATGSVTVIAPEQLTVAGVETGSVRKLGGGLSESVIRWTEPRLSTWLIACAPFRQTSAVTRSGVRIRVFGSSSPGSGASEADLGKSIVDYYETVWPGYLRSELTVIETPAAIGEAVSYEGSLAISEKIMQSRAPLSGTASNLLEFVMAHEIAHQWWGYRVVPAKAAGRTFLTESMAQFAAYKFIEGRGALDEQTAIANESRRYRAAMAQLGGPEISLAQSQLGDSLVYNKGPFALLSLDRLSQGGLMNRMGSLVGDYSVESHGNTAPDRFIASLIGSLPEQHRAAAQKLIYQTGSGI